tara:strand:- start:6277 stop:8592 length:2316 start_codon:yes stop_codon:yes gene_type:complete
MNLTQLINEVIEDWFYQHPHGFAVEPYNTQDLKVLREVLESNNYPTQVIEETIEFLTELDFKDKAALAAYKADHPGMRDSTKVTIGGKETTAGEAEGDELDSTETAEAKRSSTGVHGNLEDGDNQDKHDVLEHGFDGAKEYYEKNGIKADDGKGFKKPAPGSAGSAFNEIVSGEGIHILHNNPDMTEEELAGQMMNEYGQTALGQEQSKSSGIVIPDKYIEVRKDAIGKRKAVELKLAGPKPSKAKKPKLLKQWEQKLAALKQNKPPTPEGDEYVKSLAIEKSADQQIATYTKCIIVARAAKDKFNKSSERVSNLQNPKDKEGNPLPPIFGKAGEPQTYYGTAASLKAQQAAVESADEVIGPSGIKLKKEDVQELIRQSGGGLNPSDTATFVSDDKGVLLVQFHSDKTDPSDPQGSKTLSTDMEDLKKRIDSNTSLPPEKKKAAQAVVEEYNGQMSGIETTYNDQTAAIADALESMDINKQVEVMQELTAKSKTNKNYLNRAMFDAEGKGKLKGKYAKHLPKGADPDNLTDADKIQAIRSFIKTPTPEDAKRADKKTGDDLKVISKIAEHLSKKLGKDAPAEINIKKVLAKRRTEVVDLHRDRKNKLNEVDPGPPPLGDLQESNEVIEGFHLSILDDDKYDENEPDQNKRMKAIMSDSFDIHMGGTVANRDTLKKALGVNSLDEFKEKFRVEEKEEYTYGTGANSDTITGKKVFTYIIASDGGDPIELGEKTYRSSDGPTGTTRTIIQYAKAMQELLKNAQPKKSTDGDSE